MSAALQHTATAPNIHYFDDPDYAARKAADEAATQFRKRGSTAWFRGQGTQEFYDHLKASQKGPTAKLYIPNQEVRRATVRKMTAEGQKTFAHLHRSLPPQVQNQFTRGKDQDAHPVDGVDHVAFVEIGRMVVYNRDGTRTHVSYRQMNETPGIVADTGIKFGDIPVRKNSRDQQTMFYVVGREIRKDGSLGEIAPAYSKQGQAMVTTDLAFVRQHILAIGANNLKVEAEVKRERIQQQARSIQQTATTGQITLQQQRDAIRAHQAADRQQSMAPRPQPRRHQEEEAYQPRVYA